MPPNDSVGIQPTAAGLALEFISDRRQHRRLIVMPPAITNAEPIKSAISTRWFSGGDGQS
jgi:hypothetical protein